MIPLLHLYNKNDQLHLWFGYHRLETWKNEHDRALSIRKKAYRFQELWVSSSSFLLANDKKVRRLLIIKLHIQICKIYCSSVMKIIKRFQMEIVKLDLISVKGGKVSFHYQLFTMYCKVTIRITHISFTWLSSSNLLLHFFLGRSLRIHL